MDDSSPKQPKKVVIFEDENKYMMRSSLFFIAPGLYALYKKQTLFGAMLMTGPLISYKFWSQPRYDHWRTLDIVGVNFAMGMFCANTAWRIQTRGYKYTIPVIYLLGGLSYVKGIQEHEKKNKFWYYYHLGMHGMMWLGHSLNVCLVANGK